MANPIMKTMLKLQNTKVSLFSFDDGNPKLHVSALELLYYIASGFCALDIFVMFAIFIIALKLHISNDAAIIVA